MRELKIRKTTLSESEREERLNRFLDILTTKEKYNDFKNRIYANLVKYKNEHITTDCGSYMGRKQEEFLPKVYWNDTPAMLYEGIKATVEDIQKSDYKYKPHLFASKHVASSQTACVNLFVPILESPMVNDILKSLDACPKDFEHIAKNHLYNGYRFEFWDSVDENSKGLLGDHTKQAGTDSDVAIAYYNTDGDLCLWLIEHKLTEQEFTTCGAYNSKGNNAEGRHNCLTCTMGDILANSDKCYYHKVNKYNYWKIMAVGAVDFYSGEYSGKGCPFRGGLNQLWRNQLLAIALEKEGTYTNVSFSVVYHPENTSLNTSIQTYSKLTNYSPKFNSFTSDQLINAAKCDNSLKEWITWFEKVYLMK